MVQSSYLFRFLIAPGKQFFLAQAFTNFQNLRRQGEVYWQKGFHILQSRSYRTTIIRLQ